MTSEQGRQESDEEFMHALALGVGRYWALDSDVLQGDDTSALLVARAATDEDARYLATVLNYDLDAIRAAEAENAQLRDALGYIARRAERKMKGPDGYYAIAARARAALDALEGGVNT